MIRMFLWPHCRLRQMLFENYMALLVHEFFDRLLGFYWYASYRWPTQLR